jgi:hypothetical protein
MAEAAEAGVGGSVGFRLRGIFGSFTPKNTKAHEALSSFVSFGVNFEHSSRIESMEWLARPVGSRRRRPDAAGLLAFAPRDTI